MVHFFTFGHSLKPATMPTFVIVTCYVGWLYNLFGHRPVMFKRAVIGSKGEWKLGTIFVCGKVFQNWLIIKLGIILYIFFCFVFVALRPMSTAMVIAGRSVH